MEKESLLTSITKASAAHLISEEEVLAAWHQGSGIVRRPARKKTSLTTILYGIGGVIVAIGIVLFFQQHWQELSSNARIAVTLGSGIALYTAGILLSRTPSARGVAWAFFLAFCLLTPFGIWVTFDSYGVQLPFFGYETVISLILFIWVLVSFFLLRMNIFLLASVLSGSILYFGLTADLLSHNPAIDLSDAFEYRFLFLGASYYLLAYTFTRIAPLLTPWMYGLGAALFLGAAMSLGGYAPSASIGWEVVFPGLALGSMFLSVPLKSRVLLAVSSLYLMGYIIKITAEYFSDTLGWPIALILAGFFLIAVGYATYTLGFRRASGAHPA